MSEQESADIPRYIEAAEFRPPSRMPQLPRPRLRWIPFALTVIVIAAIWLVWFVFTARAVHLELEPATAEAGFDELFAPRIGNHWLVRPGPRIAEASAPGYRPYRATLEVGAAPEQRFEVRLEPLPGHLTVVTEPDLGATVLVDNADEYVAPVTIRELEAGTHEVAVSAERYLPFETVVEIEGREIEQTLEVKLRPAWATATFESTPPGATVRVDGETAGQTPLTSEIIQGQREIRVELEGYKTWRREVAVEAGQPLNLKNIVLVRADGTLRLVSRPPQASVTVDDEFQGRSPLEIAVTPDTEHRVRFSRDGYQAATRSARTASGATTTVDVTLEPILGSVRFQGTPADAEIVVDGKSLGTAGTTLKLPAHPHEVLIRKTGYASETESVTPRKGVIKLVRYKLEREGSGGAAATAKPTSATGESVTTTLGQVLKRFEGGGVQMGSSRRDPDRRANEALRSVTLTRPFYLGLKEVTNAEYRRFRANHVSRSDNGQNLDGDTQPVVQVDWIDAALFCNWLSREDALTPFYQIKGGRVLGVNPSATGYRLPTEAEWAWAARTAPGNETFDFPWFGAYPPRGRSGNYADQAASAILGNTLADYFDGFAVTAPVGSFPANLRGLYDLGGNVSEWTHDVYSAAPRDDGARDPLGSATGAQHVVRGSSWAHAGATELRLAYRDGFSGPRDDLGFRLARYAR